MTHDGRQIVANLVHFRSRVISHLANISMPYTLSVLNVVLYSGIDTRTL